MSLTLSPPALRRAAVQLPTYQSTVSPLTIADRLITLAQDAERAGYRATASHLVELAYSVFDEVHIH